MPLELIRNEAAAPLPRQQFVNELKRLIRTWTEAKFGNDLETLLDRIQRLKQAHRIQVPSFKIERWFVWLENKTLHIRYGDSGEAQLFVKEVEA